jgi:hypothetical protein
MAIYNLYATGLSAVMFALFAREIGAAFPSLPWVAEYCTEATNGMPWCGDFIGYVLKDFGIPPPAVKDGVGFFFVDLCFFSFGSKLDFDWLAVGSKLDFGQHFDASNAL